MLQFYHKKGKVQFYNIDNFGDIFGDIFIDSCCDLFTENYPSPVHYIISNG